MSSTVTTTTVSTITTVALLSSLGLVAIVTLLLLLIKKEIISTSAHPQLQTLSRLLNIAIVPLVMVFVMIAAVNLAQVWR
jgi:hypothetical protein